MQPKAPVWTAVVGAVLLIVLGLAVSTAILLVVFNALGVADWLGLSSLGIKPALGLTVLLGLLAARVHSNA